MFMFCFGQCAMWAFGIFGKHDLSYQYSAEQILKAEIYTCLSVLVFHIGALIMSNVHITVSREKTIINHNRLDRQRANLFFVCKCLTFITIPLAIFSAIRDFTIANTYGYIALYYGEHATQSGYAQILMYLFVPCLFGLLIGSDFEKNTCRFVNIVFGLYAFCYILSGERGNWLYTLIILIYLYTRNKKLNFKRIISICLLGYLGIFLLSVVTANRSNLSVLSIDTIITEAFSPENSPIVSTFFEMGGSMGIITNLLSTGKDIFPYSNTYITALLGMVSTRFVSLFGLDFVLLGDWYSQDYLRISWGAGFSMIGEAYINGGYIGGLIYMLILGMVIGKILKINVDNTNSITLFISASVLNAICRFPRSASYLLVKQIFYSVGIILIVMLFLESIKRRKNG